MAAPSLERVQLARGAARVLESQGCVEAAAAVLELAEYVTRRAYRRPRTGLSKRQVQILDYVEDFIESRGYSPSFQEIAGHCGLSSLGTVHEHLENLVQKGFIRRGFNESRSLEIVSAEGL